MTLATVIVVMCYIAQKRRDILIYSGLCASLYVFYWYGCGEMTACAISMLAVVGVSIQLLTPEHLLEKTALPRTMFTALLVAAACMIRVQDFFDLLPVVGFTFARFSETLRRPVNIRCGYMICGIIWLTFAIITHNDSAVISNIVCMTVQLSLFYRDFIRPRLMLSKIAVKSV